MLNSLLNNPIFDLVIIGSILAGLRSELEELFWLEDSAEGSILSQEKALEFETKDSTEEEGVDCPVEFNPVTWWENVAGAATTIEEVRAATGIKEETSPPSRFEAENDKRAICSG